MTIRPTAAALLLAALFLGPAAAPAQTLGELLRAASPGDALTIGNPSVIRLNPAGSALLADAGGTFFYSDDPESVTANGILYADNLPAGLHRIYLYHTNDTPTPRKFSVVLENIGGATATVTFQRRSIPAPSGNYFQVGKTGSQLFFTNTTLPAPLSIPPGARAIMDPAVESLSLNRHALIATIHDYVTDQPLRATSVMLNPSDDTLAVFPSLTPSPTDGLARQGTFPATSRIKTTPFQYDTASSLEGRRVIRIADTGDAFPSDPAIAGFDAQRGIPTILPGNFGIHYDITVDVRSSDNRDVALLVNPRGGGYAGWFQTTFAGVTTGTMAPSNQLTIPDSSTAVLLRILSPGATPQPLRIEFVPAGASNLPFHLLFLPIERETHGADRWLLVE